MGFIERKKTNKKKDCGQVGTMARSQIVEVKKFRPIKNVPEKKRFINKCMS